MIVVADVDAAAAQAAAVKGDCAWTDDWKIVVTHPDVDIVVVATPNAFLAEVSVAALGAGKHVLLEKPMGRSLQEARAIAAAASKSGKRVKVGFNHRYHPAIRRAHELFVNGGIGRLINLRIRYGHGGRPGYEKEWRGQPKLAGGGELTDQGVHALDLLMWYAGVPRSVVGMTQSAVWPIAPLEDNGWALLRFEHDVVASFHTSWTQWKNLFCFEIFGENGALVVEGLGGSYGVETLTSYERAGSGGPPAASIEKFEGPDQSWKSEWGAFLDGILAGLPYDGDAEAGLDAMVVLDALYRSSESGNVVQIRATEPG